MAEILKSYGDWMLNGISFKVEKGDKIAIIGSNGAGKTTLLNILMEQLDPDGGTLKWGTTISTTIFSSKRQPIL